MSTGKLYHYTYIITNVIENKYYIGCRSCHILPEKDLGIKYFSSSKDKEFRSDQKTNPQHYNYKVIAVFGDRVSAMMLEIKLHAIHDVGVNPKFYNRAKQTALGWDTCGVKVGPPKKPMSEEQKQYLSKINSGENNPMFGKPVSAETRAKIGKAHKDKVVSESTKELLRRINTGKTMSTETVQAISKAMTGAANPRARKCNIYKYPTNELVAEGVCLTVWAKEHNNSPSNLRNTTTTDYSKPHHRVSNIHSSKGFYARYTD